MKSKSASAVLLALGCLTMFVMGCSEIGIQISHRDASVGHTRNCGSWPDMPHQLRSRRG